MSPTFDHPNAALPPLPVVGGGGNAAMRGRSPTMPVAMGAPKGHGKGGGMMPAAVRPSIPQGNSFANVAPIPQGNSFANVAPIPQGNSFASVAPRHPGQLIPVPVAHVQRPGAPPAGLQIQQQLPRQQAQPQPRPVQIQEVIRQVPKMQVVTQEKIVEQPQIQYVEKIVEVPQIVTQYVEKIVEVPKIVTQVVDRQVPKFEYVTQERIVDVPEIRYVEKIVEVPQTVVQVVDRHVPRIQIQEVVRHVPVIRIQQQERIVEAPMMVQQVETTLVPAIGATSSMQMSMDYQQYADPAVAADFAMMVQPSHYDYSQVRQDANRVTRNYANVPAEAGCQYDYSQARFVDPQLVRSSDGTLRSSSFAPDAYQNDANAYQNQLMDNQVDQNAYRIEDQLMDNQGYIQQGTYEIDGQGYYVDEQGGIFQIDTEEPQHNDLQQIQDQQAQYENGGYVNNNGGYYTEDGIEYMDGQQQQQVDDDQYARYEQYEQAPQNIEQYEPYEVGADVAAGLARQPQEETQDEPQAEDQFTRLLNSLEARVDLMAQMQHTRAEIQKHTKNLQNNKAGGQGNNQILELPSTDQSQVPMVELEPDRPFSSFAQYQSSEVQYQSSGNNYEEEVLEQQIVPIGGTGARLVRDNAMLRSEFQDQQGVVTDLQREVAGMRTQLLSLSVEPESGMAESNILLAVGTRVEARWMKDDGSDASFGTQWLSGYISRANQDGTFQVEYDNGAACSRVPRQYLRSVCEEQYEDPSDPEVSNLQMALAQERQRHESSTQQWSRERQRLLDELTTLKTQSMVGPGGRRALGNLPTVGEDANSGFSSMLHTNQVLPASGLQLAVNSRLMAPLCRNPCGMNIELSEDGYTAKRIRGCRQSVVIGSTPLERQELGHYFEVVVQETVNGWVGGLGIGVTRVSPAELKRMPDKAWRIPSTFIVGYWGCLFLDGREKRTRWKADTLTVGSRVGLLVTGDGRGDLIVFVDGEPVVRADDVLPSSGLRSEELYPVIDVFAATLSVELQQSAVAPAKPWSSNPSPPGSPGSTATRSIGSASLSVGTRAMPSVG